MNQNAAGTATPTAPGSERPCRHCRQAIAADAKVCHHCGKNQNPLWSSLEKIGIIGSIALVFLAFLQFAEVREETIKAKKALAAAQEARNEAQSAAKQAQQTAEHIAHVNYDLRQQVLSVAKMFYLQVVTRNDFTRERGGKAAQAILKELDVVLPRALPNIAERAEWIKQLKEFMPPTRKK